MIEWYEINGGIIMAGFWTLAMVVYGLTLIWLMNRIEKLEKRR